MEAKPPIRIKFMGRAPAAQSPQIWLRQLPGGSTLYRSSEFIFDPDADDYDWLVVYDDLPPRPGERISTRKIDLACPRAHTMLITMEPSTIKRYGRAYLSQFGHVLSSQDPKIIRHPRHIYAQAGLRWYYGLGSRHMLSYDDIAANPPLAKTSGLSTVCSSKQQRHTLHNDRYLFVQEIKARLPELEIYGHGVRDMDDKAEALSPYRYHIAIENFQGPHHWTEKLSDCFLACCLPFYFGAPNADDYFPQESFIPIDLGNVEASADIIRKAMNGDEWGKRLPAILEARRLCLEDYSLFAQVDRLVAERDAVACSPERGVLRARRAARKAAPMSAIPDMAHMLFQKARAALRG